MEAPTAASDVDLPAPQRPLELSDDPTDRIVLGVAGYLADGIGVDALWVRLGFVILALVGGIGVLAYLGLWLVVFGPARTGFQFVRYVGGAMLVAGLPLVIAGSDLEFVSGPIAVVALLIGLTLALWQPRSATSTGALPPRSLPPTAHASTWTQATNANIETSPEDDVVDGPKAPDEADSVAPAQARSERRPRRVRRRSRPPREPSILGRLTFGLAVIAAAVGALIDYLNGGRMHPEQWLGVAALICGIGLLVGAVRGRAWWLIVPALLFAGTGYLTGLMARIGLDATDAFGDNSFSVNESTPAGSHDLSQLVGDMWISIDGVPENPVTIDAKAAIGSLEMSVNDAVSVEIRSDTDRGNLTVNAIAMPDGVAHIGPDGPPDVIVDARLGIGDVRSGTYRYDPDDDIDGAQQLLGEGPFDPLVLEHAVGVQVDDGVGITSDGWIVLAYGEALIAPDNSVAVGEVTTRTSNSTMISTSMDPFQVDAGILRTPWGGEYDLAELRQQFSTDTTAIAPTTTISTAPLITVAPLNVDPTVPDIEPTPSTTAPSNQTTTGG